MTILIQGNIQVQCNPCQNTSVFHRSRTNISKICRSEVAQLCPTVCDPINCSVPGSSVHGIFQATVLERIAISFSRESSQPRAQTQVSCIVDRRFTVWATREVLESIWAGSKPPLTFFSELQLIYKTQILTPRHLPQGIQEGCREGWRRVVSLPLTAKR